GIPEKEASVVRAWADALIDADPNSMTVKYTDWPGQAEFRAYVQKMIDSRRSNPNPPDDIVTRMVQYVDETGRRFSDTELHSQIQSLILAGNETTTHLIGNLFHELVSRPELWEQVRQDRNLVPV